MREMIEDLKRRAEGAADKPAALGMDIDLAEFGEQPPGYDYRDSLEKIHELDAEEMARTGVRVDMEERSGSFVQIDDTVVHASAVEQGIEVLGTREALEGYEWLWNYYWKAVQVDQDKYTADVELHPYDGYFIHALPGARIIYPLQACMYLRSPRYIQRLHNLIVVEEGAELHIITGCASEHEIESALHEGVSEFYVKKGAKLTFTMVHNWHHNMYVRPRSGIIVEEGGVFINNYICLEPVRYLQTYPAAWLRGEGAVARFNTMMVAAQGSLMDVGSRVILQAPGTRAEVISRAVTRGGEVIARGQIVGEVGGVKAHLECHGLILGEGGRVYAVPELDGRDPDVDMSHEAAVGKIAQEEVEYLMARGLTEEEATSAIVRGFLNVRIEGLPPQLQQEIQHMLDKSETGI
jgi:hypothetical protein